MDDGIPESACSCISRLRTFFYFMLEPRRKRVVVDAYGGEIFMFGFESGFRVFLQIAQRPFEDRPARSFFTTPVAGFGVSALAVLLLVLGATIWSHGSRTSTVTAPVMTAAHKLHLMPAEPPAQSPQQ